VNGDMIKDCYTYGLSAISDRSVVLKGCNGDQDNLFFCAKPPRAICGCMGAACKAVGTARRISVVAAIRLWSEDGESKH